MNNIMSKIYIDEILYPKGLAPKRVKGLSEEEEKEKKRLKKLKKKGISASKDDVIDDIMDDMKAEEKEAKKLAKAARRHGGMFYDGTDLLHDDMPWRF